MYTYITPAMYKHITYGQLRSLLTGLGFQETRHPEGIALFHRETNSWFEFRPFDAKDQIKASEVRQVRKRLNARGLLSADAFDKMLANGTKQITYGQIRDLLTGLGFNEIYRPEGIALKYPKKKDTLFLFRPLQDTDQVRPFEVLHVRELLDARGLLDPDAFDSMLTKTPA